LDIEKQNKNKPMKQRKVVINRKLQTKNMFGKENVMKRQNLKKKFTKK
jgi:hypothetical protein